MPAARLPPPRSRRRRARVAAAALGAVLAVDLVGLPRTRRRAVAGVLDETAHLATGALAIGAAAGRVPRDAAAGLLAASVLVDADHLPDQLGARFLRRGSARPLPHSIATVAAVGALAALVPARRRAAALGALAGTALHLARDLATPPGVGVPLWWPASGRTVALGYAPYAALVAVLALRGSLLTYE